MLELTSRWSKYFDVSTFWDALLGSLLISVISAVLTSGGRVLEGRA